MKFKFKQGYCGSIKYIIKRLNAEAVKEVKETDKVTSRETRTNEAGYRKLPVDLPPAPNPRQTAVNP